MKTVLHTKYDYNTRGKKRWDVMEKGSFEVKKTDLGV